MCGKYSLYYEFVFIFCPKGAAFITKVQLWLGMITSSTLCKDWRYVHVFSMLFKIHSFLKVLFSSEQIVWQKLLVAAP